MPEPVHLALVATLALHGCLKGSRDDLMPKNALNEHRANR